MFALSFGEPPVTTIVLARRLGVRWPTLIRVLDDLERDGLIVRRDNPEDRRSRWIELSAKGHAVIRDIQAILDPARAEILADLTKEELLLCGKLLDRILSRIRTVHDGAAPAGAADPDS